MFRKLCATDYIYSGMVGCRFSLVLVLGGTVLLPCLAFCQSAPPGDPIQPGTIKKNDDNRSSEPEGKRIFWIIPNFRTSPTLAEYTPLTPKEKLNIAVQDSFDRGTIALAALFAGEGQLGNSNRSFGQGVEGYARYFGTSYADFVIGDFMTESIFPTVLHQDPRYFRRGVGSGWSRFGYACGQIFWTHQDSGHSQFNFSEIAGNSTAVAISNLYYTDNRTVSSGISKLGVQLGVDMASNVLKEFWPDLSRKFSRKPHSQAAGTGR